MCGVGKAVRFGASSLNGHAGSGYRLRLLSARYARSKYAGSGYRLRLLSARYARSEKAVSKHCYAELRRFCAVSAKPSALVPAP